MTLYMPTDVYLLKFRFTMTGRVQEAIVTTAVKDTSGGNGTPAAVAGTASTTFQAGFATSEFGSFCAFVGVEAIKGNNDNPPIEKAVVTLGTPYTGTSSATFPPPNVAVVCKKNTEYIGRKYRGRFYLPSYFVSETMVDNLGNLTSGAVTSINSSLSAWRAALVNAVYPLDTVLLHPVGSPSLAPTPVITWTVASKVGTQRRRLR